MRVKIGDSVVEVLHGNDAEHAKKANTNNNNSNTNQHQQPTTEHSIQKYILATKLLQEQMAIN